jgi:hypothetical protein
MSASCQNLARRHPLATNCPCPGTPSNEPIPCRPDVLKCDRAGPGVILWRTLGVSVGSHGWLAVDRFWAGGDDPDPGVGE